MITRNLTMLGAWDRPSLSERDKKRDSEPE